VTKARRTKVPDIPSVTDASPLGRASAAAKEALDVGLGRRGDRRDAWVTFRDLEEGGLATLGFGRGGGGSTDGNGAGGGPGGIFLTPLPPGTQPPPPYVLVTTASVWDGILIRIQTPAGYYEYAYFEVWGAPQIEEATIPTFAQATIIGTTASSVFVHGNLGLNAVWWYWVRAVGFPDPTNPNGEPQVGGFSPSETGQGVRGTTAIDPEYVLGVLEGQINEDALALGLHRRIDLVDHYYDAAGNLIPLPTDIGSVPIYNRILAAVNDASLELTAAIAEEAAIRQLDDNTIAASWSLRIDIGGVVSGFGLIATRTSDDDPLTPDVTESTFIIRANRFAIQFPIDAGQGGVAEQYPFIVGTVAGIPTVGVNGQLVVDGSITAHSIQANVIGANQINAQSVWAGIVSADRVFASSFSTSDDLNFRAVIGGVESNFPIWYGSGQVGDQTLPGVSNPVFYVDRNGRVGLAGDLICSGSGKFRTTDGDGVRVEIGSGLDASGFVLWAGAGPKIADNAVFYVDSSGNAVFRGVLRLDADALTIPLVSADVPGGGVATINVIPRQNQGTAPVAVFATGYVRETGSGADDKQVEITLKIAGQVVHQYSMDDVNEEQFTVVAMGVNVQAPGGPCPVQLEVRSLFGAQVTLSSYRVIAFQVQVVG
jgi:hypothetical protein